MKKVLLSALAVSVMFVSCNDKEDPKNPITPPNNQEIALSKTFEKVYDIQQNMYEKSSDELVSIFNSFKSDVSSDAHADLTGWIENIKVETPASKGKAGKLEVTDKDGKVNKRYLNERGVENGQLLKKGLIGALQLKQALNYSKKLRKSGLTKEEQEEILKGFSTALLGSYAAIDNEKEKLESHGTEFMGYPVVKGNEFAKYANVVDYKQPQFKGISDELYNALKEAKKNLGDQALVSSNIMKALNTAQKIVAARGVWYLKEASKLEGQNLKPGVAHAISEGLGFLYSLQYTYSIKDHGPYLTRDEVTKFMENLDLWNGDEATEKLEDISKKIAEKFGFDWSKA